MIAAPAQNGKPANIYVTLVSPVPVPEKLFTRRGAKIIAQAKGPQVCSATKTVHGGHGQAAFLNGKTITLKINGSNPLLPTICGILKKATFNPTQITGG